jgi:23S rRNA-/tRNA-specific pseudouridylate synthase
MKRWVVRAGDGANVGEILRRMNEGEGAIGDGRVFVGQKRVTYIDHPVRPGDEVRVGSEGARAEATILFEKDGIVACVKPAGIPTVPDHASSSHALVASVARAVGRRAEELRVTSRLDREVSGVVLFALDARAEERLREARANGRYARRYVAMADGRAERTESRLGGVATEKGSGVWDAPIGAGKDPRHRAAFGADAKKALTRWSSVATAGGYALLAIDPVTGRTHQIRVHASHAKIPLLGDRDYGGATRLTLAGGRVVALSRIALHCARVAVEEIVATAPIPEDLAAAWTALGGAPEAWEKAVSCVISGEPPP